MYLQRTIICLGRVHNISLELSGNDRYCRVEKYRPVTLDDLVSHKDITSTSMLLASNLLKVVS